MTPPLRGPFLWKNVSAHAFICVCLCAFRSAPDLTSPTCDTQRGSDPLTPAGTHTSLVLIDFGFMLAGQIQNGNRKKKREKKNREKENKHKTEDNTERFKPCGSLASKQQAALDGKKRHPRVLILQVMCVWKCCYPCEELETKTFRRSYADSKRK